MLGERFWSKVDKSGSSGCWEWTASRNRAGYGQFRPGGMANMRGSHVLSYEDAFGSVPKGLFVCHSCDNPACVNPSHLWLGTNAENVADMIAKGRKSRVAAPGEKNGNAALTAADVVEIRRLYVAGVSRPEIAKRFSIRLSSLSDYTSGRSWKHLKDGPTFAQLRAAKRTKPSAKITPEVARAIKARLARGETGRALAREFGVHFASISDIKTGKTWRDV